ncbi:hypothetical protein R1flu_007157 [Riccia fluitans]|uniref:Signal recognition particle subunit SRP72 n=1 Tax=Riccia fluitans TaxID=41844 RepID=A0ABD1YYV3_9MARC
MAPKVKGKAKPTGTAAIAAVGPSLDDLFSTLDRLVKNKQYKQILKVTDDILKLSQGDKDAVECKVVALIQLDDFDQALAVIDSSPGIDLVFQKAYCLYKRNRLQEALTALQNTEKSSPVLQLEAQIQFKLGNFTACIANHEKLLQKHQKIDSDEVKSNVIAAYVSGGRSKEVPSLMESMKVTAKSNFYLAYNAACALTEKGDYTKAEEHLLLARRIGQEALIEEEFLEEEIEDELAPITVQLAYVQQMQGRGAEALDSYNAFLKKKVQDDSSIAVASNNLIALRGARDLFDALKKFDKIFEKKAGGHRLQFSEKLDSRLSAKQKEAISFNSILLLLHSNKLDQARELLPYLFDTYPNTEVPTLLSASLAIKEGKSGRAEDILNQYAVKHPGNSTAAYLAGAQVAASSGNYARAADCLEKIVDEQHKLGMVATLVALRERAGNPKAAEAVLDAAVEWWDNHMSEDPSVVEQLIQEAAAFKLKHNKLEDAAKLFERLTKSSSSVVRAEALNGLVSSTAYANPAKAESYEQKLPPLTGLKHIDVDALERAAPVTSSMKRGRGQEDGQSKGDEKIEKAVRPKKKRKRKPLYPKNFDPAKPGPPPDPERWLPKRERSSFKPKKKRGAAEKVRGAQGSSAAANAATHTTASGATRSGPAAPAPPAKTTPEPPKPSSSSRNKKKGRR